MSNMIIFILILLGILWLGYWMRTAQAAKIRQILKEMTVWGLMGLCVLGTLTGRIHPFFFAFGGLLPLLYRVSRRKRPHSATIETQQLTEAEAWSILGLPPNSDVDAIRAAHRRLMQRVHPDRGGSDYLAAQINTAKYLLLNKNHQKR